MLLPTQKQSHVFIEMNSAPDHNTSVENLVAATKFIKELRIESLWESHYIDKSTSNVKCSSFKPRCCVSSGVDVSLIAEK